ncbi:hypothetical protein Tco_0280455 [Tanacetum coccineum]
MVNHRTSKAIGHSEEPVITFRRLQLQSQDVQINPVQAVDDSLIVSKSTWIESENNHALGKSVNETQLQQHESLVTESTTLEANLNTDVKALDVGSIITESSGTKSDKHDTSNSSGTYITHDVDADIRPVNDQVPFAEVQLTAQHNVLANEQQHTEQSKPIYDTYLLEKVDSNTTPDSTNMCHRGGEIYQDAEQYQEKSPLLKAEFLITNDMVEKEVYNELSNRFLQLEKHCISLEISMQQKDTSFQSTQTMFNPLRLETYKPVEPKSHTQKPGRKIAIGQRFSLNKSSAVHEKLNTPRSCLRWIPTGKIFKLAGLRWIPTRKLFNSYMSKVDSEPPNGSNDDITNPYECNQTLNVSAGTLNLSAVQASLFNDRWRLQTTLQAPFLKEKKGVCFSALYLQKKRNLFVLDHSHQHPSNFPMLVQSLSGSTTSILVAVAAPRPVDPAGSPLSTTIDQDVPSASTSPTNQEIQFQVTHQGVEEQIHGHQNAQFDNAPLLHNLPSDPSSEETTLQGVISSNLHHLNQSQNQRDLPRDNPLVSVEVLRYDIKRSKSENKGIMPTEMELVLEQTQQGSSPLQPPITKPKLTIESRAKISSINLIRTLFHITCSSHNVKTRVIIRVLRIILVVLPDHPSDTKVQYLYCKTVLTEPEDYIEMEMQIPRSSIVKFIATCSYSRLNDFKTSRKNDPKLPQTLISTSSSVCQSDEVMN